MSNIELIALNYDAIDEDHQAFAELVNKIKTSDNVQFATLYQQLLEHTEQHFDHENQLMERYQYPAMAEHRGEHNRVLSEIKDFKKRVDRGLMPFAKAFVMERLIPWFNLHLPTMDSALIAHIKNLDNQ